MTFPLQNLPPEIVGEIARHLDAEDVLNLCHCVNFDVSKSHCRLYPFDSPLDRYTLKGFEGRVNARAYKLSHQPEPVGLRESILKVCSGFDFVYFLTAKGDIWFTGDKIWATHRMMKKAHKEWTFRDGLGQLRSEEAFMSITEDYATDEWKKQHPDTMRPIKRRYVDIGEASWQTCGLSMVDDSGISTSFYNDIPSKSWTKSGWFDRDYATDIPQGDGYAEEKTPWITHPVLRAHSSCALYEGKGLSVSGGTAKFRDDIVDALVLIPNTASGVKDWAAFDRCVVCLRTNGSVDKTQIPLRSLRGEFPVNHEFRPEDFDSLKELNQVAKFVQISSCGNRLALVTTTGRLVTGVVTGSKIDIYMGCGLRNVSSVAIGESHWLAMTKNGEVYSWGWERQSRRCLGLGKGIPPGAIIQNENGQQYVFVNNPTRVKLPGRAYYISAGPEVSIVLCEKPRNRSHFLFALIMCVCLAVLVVGLCMNTHCVYFMP